MEQNFNQSSTLSVLVATQDEAVKRQVLNVLEKKEYPVVVAHDCEQVLEYLLDRDFDVVIFDPSIKELEGSDAIKLIKRLRPQLPLVVLADESSYETSIKIAVPSTVPKLPKSRSPHLHNPPQLGKVI